MGKQKGFSAVLLLIILAVLAFVVLLIISNNLTILQFGRQEVDRSIVPNEAQVTLQTKYQNPFDKNAQYVNPFSEYQNPFDQLK